MTEGELAADEILLEELLDRHGMKQVLESLAKICYEKSTHIESNWGDRVLIESWKRAGGRLDTVSASNCVALCTGE